MKGFNVKDREEIKLNYKWGPLALNPCDYIRKVH